MKLDIDPLIERARAAMPPCEGDFRDPETGFLMCGKCGTPKEMRIKLCEEERVVPVLCRCAKESRDAEERERRERERRKVIARRREECFGGSGGKRAGFTFAADDGADPETMTCARGYAEEFASLRERGKGILFLGGTGTGKTFAACAIANALLEQGYTVRVITFAEIAAKLQSSWESQGIYRDLQRYDLLVLDDLGAERNTSYMDEIVYNVIDSRCSAGKPLIVTTNLRVDDFTDGQSPRARIYSRLYESCIPVVVRGRDRRRAAMTRDGQSDLDLIRRAGMRRDGV